MVENISFSMKGYEFKACCLAFILYFYFYYSSISFFRIHIYRTCWNGRKKDIQTEKEIDPLRDTRKLTDVTPTRDK
jgi:hypothetical protein